ncbi:MAG: hypothetical protein ACRDTD_30080, partial [Pseudonocardiaceae bacterium]
IPAMKNFVITGTQRTGSAAVMRALRHHDLVACGAEWPIAVSFTRRLDACRRGLDGDFSKLLLRHREEIAAQISTQTDWLGYRNLFRANDKWWLEPALGVSVLLDRFHATLEWWRRHAAIHIVHVTRTDNLAWLRSKYKARESGTFWAGTGYSQASVVVPIHNAVKRVRMKVWLDEQLAGLRNSNPYYLVRHEAFLADPDGTATGTQAFLGLSPQLIPAEQVPQRQSAGVPIEHHIQNYDELRRALERAGLLTG